MIVRVRAPRTRTGREARRLRRSLAKMMETLAPGTDLELSVSLVSDGEIAVLNQEHLGTAGPTDVLSFPLMTATEIAGVAQRHLAGPEPVGDIVIGLQTARRQAAERGVTASDELELLAAHGLLHLFGYDHMFPAEAEEMARQERMLLGRSIINEATGEG